MAWWTPADKSRRAALGCLLALGAALRFATLDLQSVWYDEAATARLMRISFPAMLRGVSRSESTPPLYYALEWLWTRPLGTGPVALRSLSALAGTATIAIVYLAASALLAGLGERSARRGALAASALVAFNPLLIWYSQEARAYALLVLLIAAGLWALARAAGGGRRSLAAWAVLSALAIATHYFAIFIVGPELVWLAWRWWRGRGREVAAACAVVVASGLALAPLALEQQARNKAGFIASSSFALRLAALPKQFLSGYAAPAEVELTVLAVAAALIGAALLWRWQRTVAGVAGGGGSSVRWLLALVVVALVVPLALALLGWDYVITRNLIATLVPLVILLAAGMTRSRLGAAALVTLCAVGLASYVGVGLDVRYQRQDWRDAAASLPETGPTALIISPAAGVLPLSYYRSGLEAMPASTSVQQIEMIWFAPRATGAGSTLPALPVVLPTLPGFASPQLERYTTFIVLRYRSDERTSAALTSGELASLELGGEGSASVRLLP